MNILCYTSIFPSQCTPTHGIFVHELVRGLSGLTQVEMVVPESGWACLRKRTSRLGSSSFQICKEHRCRFWTVPKLLKTFDASLMAYFSHTAFKAAFNGKPDLVHAHYAYPDAAAAAILANRARLPLVVTCHGSDINFLARESDRKMHIVQTLRQAAAVITVSADLHDKVMALGVPPDRIWTIPNGVDVSVFELGDKSQARSKLELDDSSPLLLAVGRLEPVKGYDRLLRALVHLPHARLILAGQGSLRQSLERLATSLGINSRVHFAGDVPHHKLATYFQAADLLVISSHSEGWPTTIHEALACGTPVVAPAIGGIPDALADPNLGVLIDTGEPDNLAQGIRQAMNTSWTPSNLHKAAALHDWLSIAAKHVQLYENILASTSTKN